MDPRRVDQFGDQRRAATAGRNIVERQPQPGATGLVSVLNFVDVPANLSAGGQHPAVRGNDRLESAGNELFSSFVVFGAEGILQGN
jgi:hypothetical protein